MTRKQKKWLLRIGIALCLFVAAMAIPFNQLFPSPLALYAELVAFLIPYLVAGYDVLLKAFRNIFKGQVFDENFLMTIATIGAFLLVLFPDAEQHFSEGAAVMLFYQVGEWFQSYAVGRSRKSIAAMMDIAPEYANVLRDGHIKEVDPEEVQVGETIICKPGERIPLDGLLLTGVSQLDTAALTGEALPRDIAPGDEVISGCINLSGKLEIQVTKPYGQSTVARVLELVEEASDKKARTEAFITRFAHYYTPIVTLAALALAVVPPLLVGQPWGTWVQRALIFLVVSCPCALVISVPLSFFGGIGGASRLGILIKGGNYLEALAHVSTVVFDKTGTLTSGTFEVVETCPQSGVTLEQLLHVAAHAEAFSTHPIAESVRKAYTGTVTPSLVENVEERAGHGVAATVEGCRILVGSRKLMEDEGISFSPCQAPGTTLYIAQNGTYLGYIRIADVIKPQSTQAIANLQAAGINNTVMLTGDHYTTAQAVGDELGITTIKAELLPQDKVTCIEELLKTQTGKNTLAFVGDGINDAPVLTRADVGIAMGAMGSDAAIEAADVVLMDDNPQSIAKAIKLARRTMKIVWQNIIFALGIKLVVLVLAAFGIATMWLAVFADVGVAILAILNAMRCMRV